MKKYSRIVAPVILLAFFCVFATADGQESLRPVPEKMKAGYESIRALDSYSYLEFLAADEMEGRDTPSRGQKIARNYIKSLYKTWGIQPFGDQHGKSRSYEQKVSMFIKKVGPETTLEVSSPAFSRTFQYGTDFSGANGVDFPAVIEAPIVFAGYGLSAPDLGYDDFDKFDVKGKIVLITAGLPGGRDADTVFTKRENRARFSGHRTPAETCSRLLAKKGALALIIVDPSMDSRTPSPYMKDKRIRSSSHSVIAKEFAAVKPFIPTFWISPAIGDLIFEMEGKSFNAAKKAIDDSIKPNSLNLNRTKITLNLDVKLTNAASANVLGMIEGSDPILKNQYIVIGGHLDHVGMNEQGYVFNGADDDGSGSTGVLQLAKAFAANPVKPKRSIIFAQWTGEEKGLLGSGHFTEFPPVPYENIVACLNLDMICRDTPLATVKQQAEGFEVNPDEIAAMKDDPEKLLIAFTSSPSPQMAGLITELNRDYIGLSVAPMPSFPMVGNSDHFFFALKHTPSVFFFTGSNPDTHQPTDTVERINAKKMSRVVKLTYLLAFHIGDMAQRLEWK